MSLTFLLQAIADAQEQCNAAAEAEGRERPFPHSDSPLCGVRVVATGDPLQRLQGPKGVGHVTADGSPRPYAPPPEETQHLWSAKPFRDARTRVAVITLHDNHRFRGMLLELLATGCALSAACAVSEVMPTHVHPTPCAPSRQEPLDSSTLTRVCCAGRRERARRRAMPR